MNKLTKAMQKVKRKDKIKEEIEWMLQDIRKYLRNEEGKGIIT